jgi:rod shape-determining protein MreC
MRNLWNLIVQYHVALVFILFQGLALTWFISSHGYPRGKWVQRSLEWQGNWNQRLSQWDRLTELADLNRELLAENATLRAELFSAREGGAATTFAGAEVVRSTWSSSDNYFIINKGTRDGVTAGQGVLQNNNAIGRVVEASDRFALALPLINQSVEWSVRIGSNGPVARLAWEGGDATRAMLYDVPPSTVFAAGDSVVSSGFQGYFPAGLMVGTVGEEAPEFDGQFLNVPVQLAADFRTLRYVELATTGGRKEIESLLSTEGVPQP